MYQRIKERKIPNHNVVFSKFVFVQANSPIHCLLFLISADMTQKNSSIECSVPGVLISKEKDKFSLNSSSMTTQIKATKFCEISTVDLTVTTQYKYKCTGEISQKFVAFSEYMNFIRCCKIMDAKKHEKYWLRKESVAKIPYNL